MEHLSEIEDPREGPALRHNLVELLVVAICAVLSGAENCADMALWGKQKLPWLRGFPSLPNGIASHDTFSRVFRLLDAKQFEAVFRSWVGDVVGALSGTVAIDGKTVRGSHDGDASAIHMVSAFATELGLAVGQEKVAEKSNEITAIPELLNALRLKGCLVSIDAMGCQKEVARAIREQQADYLLAVKGNQGNLEESLQTFFDAARCAKLKTAGAYLETIEKDHGRIETRRYWVADNVFGLVDPNLWRDCRTAGMVESVRDTGKKEPQVERRYFISSAPLTVMRLAAAVRDHWLIENRLHWSLDVIFGEDDARTRKDHAPQNVALLSKIALNLLRMDTSQPKLSVRQRRKAAGWNDDVRMQMLGLQPVR
ncbi:MAG TPA: ISAs1 family transposase [Gemmatimonadaceae bacterium]|nr:ISAs1 family transposase [Gemmatimonadaceae bacterium]